MVKLSVAETPKKQPIGVLSALSSGFDIASSQFGLLIVPVILDVFLWLGPRLKATILGASVVFDIPSGLDLNTRLQAQNLQESVQQWFQQFNLFALLRPTLFGVPGVVGGDDVTAGAQLGWAEWQLTTPWLFLLTLVLMVALGIVIGGFYWSLVARRVRDGRIDWIAAIGRVRVIGPRMIGLALVLVIILLSIWVPTAVVSTLFGLTSGLIGTLLVMVALSLMVWVLFYISFGIHGIVLYNQSVFDAIRTSVWFSRRNFWALLAMMVLIIAIDRGMNIVWRLVPSNSWLWLLSILGNAFLVTGIAVGTMVFYMDRVPIPSSALVPRQPEHG